MGWIILTVLFGLAAIAGALVYRSGQKDIKAADAYEHPVAEPGDPYARDRQDASTRRVQGLKGVGKTKRFFGLIGFLAAVVIWLIITIFMSFYQVDSREVAVLRSFGEITGSSSSAGVQGKKPWESVEKYSTAVRKENFQVAASAKDTQEIGADVGIQYRVNPEKVEDLARNVGPDWQKVLLPDRVQQIVKDNVVAYATIDIAPNRSKLSIDTTNSLAASLAPYGVSVDQVFYANLTFPQALTDSITAKQVAQQDALKAQQLVAQRTNEADAAVAQAHGQAESNRLLAESLKTSPELLELRKAELQVDAITALAKSGNIQLVPSNIFFSTPLAKNP